MPTSTSPVLMPMRIWIGGSAPTSSTNRASVDLHPQRCAHGPLGVVLVGDRGTEEGDDGVAQQLVDAPAELLDVGDEPLEARLDQALDALGVEILGEGRVADEVGEQHRDDAPLLQRQRGGGHRIATRGAETRARRHRVSAQRTRNHRHVSNLRCRGARATVDFSRLGRAVMAATTGG